MKTAQKQDIKNTPFAEDYPVLAEWLKKQEARCDWVLPAKGGSTIEQWRFRNGRTALVVVHSNQMGWDILTSLGDDSIEATIKDAEQRLGLK